MITSFLIFRFFLFVKACSHDAICIIRFFGAIILEANQVILARTLTGVQGDIR